ncbi:MULTISPECIES: hypothetical protein [unclassified Amycolatopsis]|uniref:hypothetical protein n=1 Tax=unclassified Amycolatopsis TaxID=2618356 RepID=UPI00287B5E4F|nr:MULTISPECIES: hypothetical protein [unclassified Amycolatopsis]
MNVPRGLAVLIAARLLREDRADTRPRLDLTGTALVVAGAGLLVYPLIDPAGTNWALLVAGAVLLVVFGFQQRRAAAPLAEPLHPRRVPGRARRVAAVLRGDDRPDAGGADAAGARR